MSIYDKSSLVLIPSGTKTGKVYSQKPTNGDGDFTFTRSTAATRVNADGNIEKETSNLLLQSNSFDTTWAKTNSNVTSGQSGYDGTSDAWEFEATSTSSCNIIQNISQSGVQNFSIYAKSGTTDWLRVLGDATTDYLAFFDLNNGVVGATLGGANIDASITDVGAGWYRCSISGNASITRVIINIASGNNDISTTIGDNIYIQDAQLNQGLIAQEVITTTTSAVYGGITDNVPRLDYTDSSCPALLLEPLRTNFVTSSEYFGSLNLYGSVNATYGAYTNPSGEDSAYLLEATSAISRVQTLSSSGDGNDAVMSIFIKGNSNVSYPTLANQGGGQSTRWEFDANNVLTYYDGDAPTGDYGQEDYGNGWYRIWLKTDTTNSNTNYYRFNPDNRYGTGSLYAWGFQVEKNSSYATSYIPTYGSSVSRVQDLASFSYDAATTAWSIFMDVKNWTDVVNNGQFSLGNAADTINSLFYYGNCFGIQKEVGQAYFCSRLAVLGQSFNGKFAVIFDGVNTIKIYINGTLDATSTLADTAKTLGIDSANLYYSGSAASKEIKSLLVFPTALTDQEAIDLTTI